MKTERNRCSPLIYLITVIHCLHLAQENCLIPSKLEYNYTVDNTDEHTRKTVVYGTYFSRKPGQLYFYITFLFGWSYA